MKTFNVLVYLYFPACNLFKSFFQTKFISEFTERLFFPNPFEVELPRRCLVICKVNRVYQNTLNEFQILIINNPLARQLFSISFNTMKVIIVILFYRKIIKIHSFHCMKCRSFFLVL